MNNYTFCLGIKQCKYFSGDFERISPTKKVQCFGLVIHLPPLSTREVTTQPRIALADSQVPFGLDAFKCYNCGVSAWMSSDGVL